MFLNVLKYPRALRATPPPCPFETAFTVCFMYKFRWKFIPESTETSTNNGEQFSEICTTNRWQITQEETQMNKVLFALIMKSPCRYKCGCERSKAPCWRDGCHLAQPFFINWYWLRCIRFWCLKLKGCHKGTLAEKKWFPDLDNRETIFFCKSAFVTSMKLPYM